MEWNTVLRGKEAEIERSGIKSVLIFLLSFFTLFIIGSVILSLTLIPQYITLYPSNHLLNVIGVDTVVKGTAICSDGMMVLINGDCTCFYEIILFASILIAFPIGQRKGLMILASIPILYGMSIFRIVSCVYMGVVYGVEWFDVFHLHLWPISVILFPSVLLLVMVKGGSVLRWIKRNRR